MINWRLCSVCGLYFASIKKAGAQNPLINENDSPPPLEVHRRPQRIAAGRQREYLCAFQFQELEWVVYDDVDTEGFIILEVSSIEPGTPVIEHQESCWTEE